MPDGRGGAFAIGHLPFAMREPISLAHPSRADYPRRAPSGRTSARPATADRAIPRGPDSRRTQRMEPYMNPPAGAAGMSAVAAIEPDLTGRDLPWVRLGPGRRYFETEGGEPFLI